MCSAKSPSSYLYGIPWALWHSGFGSSEIDFCCADHHSAHMNAVASLSELGIALHEHYISLLFLLLDSLESSSKHTQFTASLLCHYIQNSRTYHINFCLRSMVKCMSVCYRVESPRQTSWAALSTSRCPGYYALPCTNFTERLHAMPCRSLESLTRSAHEW